MRRFASSAPFALVVLLVGCQREVGGTRGSGPASSAGGSAGAAGVGGGSMLGPQSAVPLTPVVRRLTRDELQNTLGDQVGISASAAELEAVPKDRPLEGFVNTATSQSASPEHVAGYASLARAIASRIEAGSLAAHGACQVTSSECQASFVASLGRLLFRRPLAAGEGVAFAALFQTAVETAAGFDEAARFVLEAMLQSPQFLYRLELETAAATGLVAGQPRPIQGYEMATRLAYLLWESAPDAALLQAAEAGTLDSVEGVQGEVLRMLQLQERTRRPTQRFLLDWARLESLPESELKAELVSSLLAFYQDFVWVKQAPLTQAFTARHAFLTPRLAQNFGLVPAGDGVLQYDLTQAPGRLGLLTQPGLLAGMTNADGGAIVARGLFLQSQLLCGETPSPPASLQEAIDAFVAEQPPSASARQIAEVRLQRPECGACHGMFDPLAYGLEQFDFQGRFRDRDELGSALTTDGWIPARFNADGLDAPYAGVEDYMQLLSQSAAVGACLAKQHLQYALGQRLEHEHDAVASELFAQVSQRGGTYAALLEAIVIHPLFRELKVQ